MVLRYASDGKHCFHCISCGAIVCSVNGGSFKLLTVSRHPEENKGLKTNLFLRDATRVQKDASSWTYFSKPVSFLQHSYTPNAMAHQQRNSNMVMDKLYLGKSVAILHQYYASLTQSSLSSLKAATATRGLTDHGITHILSVCSDPIPAEVPQSGIRHRRIDIQDVDYADLLIKLPLAVEFIYSAIYSGGAILVHDDTGNGRAAAGISHSFHHSGES